MKSKVLIRVHLFFQSLTAVILPQNPQEKGTNILVCYSESLPYSCGGDTSSLQAARSLVYFVRVGIG